MIEFQAPHPSVVLLARQHSLDGPIKVHCDLDPSKCCCAVPNVLNDVKAVMAAVEASTYRPTLPPLAVGWKEGTSAVVFKPNFSGNSCHDCGGMMVRTGTCETCTACGSTGGCG